MNRLATNPGRPEATSPARRLCPGHPWPLGATATEGGVNFALFSAHATTVELCLFDPTGRIEQARLTLPEWTDEVWHGFLPDAGPGLVYGYRDRSASRAASEYRWRASPAAPTGSRAARIAAARVASFAPPAGTSPSI
ncbi:MAG: hypothetical protein R3D25_19245 [Geminicoccaceae bacterium]